MNGNSESQPSAHNWKWRRWWILILLVALLLFHAPLLRIPTHFVSLREPLPTDVDAILIEGGDDRHDWAARWVKSGFAKNILLPQPLPERNVALGIVPPDDSFARQKLHELGVNDEAIQTLDDERFQGDWRFAWLLGQWLDEHPDAKVIVLCHQFDSRFTRLAINGVLVDSQARQVSVHGLPSLAYDGRVWWRSRPATFKLFSSLLSRTYATCVGEDQEEPLSWDPDVFETELPRP